MKKLFEQYFNLFKINSYSNNKINDNIYFTFGEYFNEKIFLFKIYNTSVFIKIDNEKEYNKNYNELELILKENNININLIKNYIQNNILQKI